MLAQVDAKYRFLWADVGSNGCCFDVQIFNACQLRQSVMDGTISFPDADPLPGDDRDMPYFIMADDAVPHNVTSVVFACVTLHNIIRTCYRADHQGLADEDNSHGPKIKIHKHNKKSQKPRKSKNNLT